LVPALSSTAPVTVPKRTGASRMPRPFRRAWMRAWTPLSPIATRVKPIGNVLVCSPEGLSGQGQGTFLRSCKLSSAGSVLLRSRTDCRWFCWVRCHSNQILTG
jgi:hypothetical protein